jgi:hypothetical protein
VAALDIDAIYAALFARLETELAGSVLMFTRRADHWDNTLTQPAMLLLATDIVPQQETGLPPVWKLGASVLIYVKAMTNDTSPETPLLRLVGELEEALQKKPGESVTVYGEDWGTNLGGLVSSIHMTKVEMTQGIEGGQAVVSVDLVMTAVTPG